MSEIRVDAIKNEAGTGAVELSQGATVPSGKTISGAGSINITGVATATSFVGNVTGNLTGNVTGTATTATNLADAANITTGTINSSRLSGSYTINVTGTATTAQGLTGNPIISVSGVNNTGVSTLTDTRLASIADKISIQSGTAVTLTYNTGGGNVVYMPSASGPVTLNVTGIPTDSSFDGRAISFAVIINQGATAYACTNVTLNGVAFGANATAGVATHIAYVSGTVATGSTTGFDVFNFTGINTTGSAATTTNYKLLSNVSGGYRRY